ncbi:hypothetical protein KHS38_12255 [Mucilaginibacter sp. Bleaf8]|uniref:hypothetical protein n=1 Tax=Mucilaginibacter sp. Bleaf8 TaxID=2834430 RepID=UPI001BD0E366|nr:hypothetical protein [Mucilaginibacter sp. Bleaf8]MBS7565176.1 hypothetical protein [Mucilaginibacter sp. Bleaf8]
MENTFEIDIPMKDHPMVIMVKPRSESNSYDLFYCDELCGCFFKNEHSVWIYEPHAHAALLLNAEQLQHLGQEIDKH